MKITIGLKILNSLLLLIYVCLIYFFDLSKYYFSLGLMFLSIHLIIEFLYFRQDSKLWFGAFLFFCGLFGLFANIYEIPLKMYYPIYFLSFGLASSLVYLFFRQKIHLKVFVINFFEVILLGIYKFAYVSALEFWMLQILLIIIVFSSLIFRAKINTRSN